MVDAVTFADVFQARRKLSGRIQRTPLVHSESLSDLTGAPTHLKLEHRQITGSFKLRGATCAIDRLTPEQAARGVVGVSTGTHGRGLAWAARDLATRCVICMSQLVPENKVSGIKALGAEVRIVGKSQDDAQEEAERLAAGEGMTMLPPFDHPHVIAGQGTLGLEILEDLPDLQSIVVPVSGGGLISGVALAVKAINPAVRVIGVSMKRGAAMYESQVAGRPVQVEELPTLADSLGGGIGLDNQYTFAMVRDLVDELLLVSEIQIADAIRHAYWEEGQIVEGAGAVGIAALRGGLIEEPGITAVVISGCNIDMTLHHSIIRRDVAVAQV